MLVDATCPEGNMLVDATCPHQRVRLVFDAEGTELDDDTGPLVVRMDDQGRLTVVSGYQGSFHPRPLGAAWRLFGGDAAEVCEAMRITHESYAQFVTVPDARTFGYVVVAHPEWIATFGGEGEERPDESWIRLGLAVTAEKVTAYINRESWEFVHDTLITGTLTRSYDSDLEDESVPFEEWVEGEAFGSYLSYDDAAAEARAYLSVQTRTCKRCQHGA